MAKRTLAPSEALYPVPVVLVSSGTPKSSNIITIAWCGIVCSQPPLISISIRPSRHSHSIIRSTGKFVINIPSSDIVKKADLCGITSGKDTDKFKLCSFTMTKGSATSTPMIEECPVNIECILKNVTSLGTHDMFIGEVVAVHADETVTDKSGRIDFKKARPFVFNQGEYWDLGSCIGSYGYSAK